MSDSPVGLIAGEGTLPLLAAKTLKKRGNEVLACSIALGSESRLQAIVDEVHRVDPAQFNTIPELFSNRGVQKLLMVGNVDKRQLYDEEEVEGAAREIQEELASLSNKGDQEIIKKAAKLLRAAGLEVMGVDEVLADSLTPAGHLAGPQPAENEMETLEVLKSLTVKLADEEVGQAAVGKKQSVIAVEGVEGTDKLIRRAGRLAGKNCVMLKRARSDQDLRFDVPVIGAETIRQLTEIKGALLAIEAERTLWVQRDECCELAEKNDLTLLGLATSPHSVWRRMSQWLGV